MFSFREHGDFHEDVVNVIMKDLIAAMDPKYIEVYGKFLPRGGISIDPYCNYGKPGTKWENVAWERMAHAGRSDKHAQVVDDFVLTGKIVKLHGTQGFLKVLVALLARVPDVEVFVHVLLIDAQNY